MMQETAKTRTNNFVIRFANVNGTGSASANGLVTKALFRMGLDVGPKNMFPSNIQGFPTWYEIRVSDRGHTARRGGVDLMVAMNPQTYDRDLAEVSPEGYYLFDEARFVTKNSKRDDIQYLAIPLTKLSLEFEHAKSRSMLKNIIYIGALTALLDLDSELVHELIRELYGQKSQLLKANFRALELGMTYARQTFSCPLPLKVQSRPPRDRILMEGNEALALGCLFAGATVCSWYPITPSTSVIDYFSSWSQRFRQQDDGKRAVAIIQAEDEIAAAGMVLGASWMGARAFTATSGPGMSLMAEFIGYAYYAEIPAVFFDIQRVGPSTGMPTRTQQSDLLSLAYLSHGDTKHILLFPGTTEECFQLAVDSFDLAEQLQTPVIVLSDIELGMNEYVGSPLKWDPLRSYHRGKTLNHDQLDQQQKPWHRYEDVDGDGICYRTLPGSHPNKGATLTRGSGHDRFGRYTEDGELYQDNMDRLARKFRTARSLLPPPIVEKRALHSKTALIYLGILHEAVQETLNRLSADGLDIDDLRLRAFPFDDAIKEFILSYPSVLVLDQNRDGQLRSLLSLDLDIDPNRLISVRSYDGLPLTADHLDHLIMKALEGLP